MQFLGSLVFTLLLFLTTAVFGLIVLACAWLPIHARYAIPRAWARVLFAMLKLLCRLDYTVEGREHLPNEPFISIWKHSSTWDTIAQMLVVPPAAWIVKREVIWIPIVGWAVATFRPIAIDRSAGGSAVKQVVAQGRKRFAEGLGVLIYPHGARRNTQVRRKRGAARHENRAAGRAYRAQLGILLAASRADEIPRNDTGRHRSADRPCGARSPRCQRARAAVDRDDDHGDHQAPRRPPGLIARVKLTFYFVR